MDNNLDLRKGGEEKDVTVMFADIRGFTSLTEKLAATEVVGLLNEYFEQMVEVVFHHEGILDKFIGDCIMAVWGTPVQHDDDAIKALAAACDMQGVLRTLNAKRIQNKLRAVQIGIGLASGPCVVGNIGANRRLEYTVIGDAVNLASRLSGEARAGQVVCDDLTFKRSGEPEDIKLKEEIKVKGKERPVPIYRIVPGEWSRTQQVSLGAVKI
jgi:adenylate cyclase